MASAWSEEETFICSVCLETLTDPATLPCGHTYCLLCIKCHWDQGDSKGHYNCPQCRQVFKPRPSLARSTVLVEAMDKLRTSFNRSASACNSSAPPSMPIYLEVLSDTQPMEGLQRQGSMYPQLPTVAPRPCPQHQRPLDLYCRDDKECVCEECCQHGHKGHSVLKPEEERRAKQKELVQIQADVKMRINETEKELQEFPQAARQQRASVQALQRESGDLFLEMVKNLELLGTEVGELLAAHEATLGSQTESHMHKLEQEVAQLRWKSQEMDRLADMQDHICFLKNFISMEPLAQTKREESGLTEEEMVVAGIRSAMTEIKDSLQDLYKGCLAKIFRAVNDASMAQLANGETATVLAAPVCEMTSTIPPLAPPTPQASATPPPHPPTPPPHPPTPPQASASAPPPLPPRRPSASPVATVGSVSQMPKTREDMLKFRCEPTMDPNTVYRHILLSEGGRKATLRAENMNPEDHPERFHFWRQVLCREPLAGSPFYWEVEWTGQKITIGVAYKEMERKSSDDQSRLGHNASSWSLYWSGAGFSFWYRGQETLLGSPKARRVGIYLDQYSGILAFYRITNSQAQLIHWHQTQFTGPLYAGFRFWSGIGTSVSVCQLD